jgi:hypothetical protein
MTSKETSKEEEFLHHVGDKRPPEKNEAVEEQEENHPKRIK